MKIPAIRAKIGTWVYYISILSFKQVNDYVKRIDDELHKSALLREMLQRSISDNYKDIAHYIVTQEERFFNSLILAVYDGEPKWHEIRIESEEDDEYMGIGVLELSGSEKIFPVDGQHRVEGIKQVVAESELFNEEKIPVIFIGHKKDEEGMQRSRRLFSTLNRYTKPVSMRDIIALDEDDIIAICSRELIDNHVLFANERILDSKTKAIPETNNSAFTTIITFYECNRYLLSLYLKSSKISEYIRRRPPEEDIKNFEKLCNEYWDSIVKNIDDVRDYIRTNPASTISMRNKRGGNLLFRPAGILPFTKAAMRIKQKRQRDFLKIFLNLPQKLLDMQCPIWNNVLWNNERKTMVMNNQKIVEIILLYFWDYELLTIREKKKMVKELRNLNQLSSDEEVTNIISQTEKIISIY